MTLAVVVDASVAIKWFVAEPDSAVADRLLEYEVDLHAPVLLANEFANALWKNCRKKVIDRNQAEAALEAIGRTVGHWHETESMLEQAFDLSLRLDHPIYDFAYLMLAKRSGLHCVTADLRFLKTIEGTEYAPHVIHFADWQP